VDQREVGKDEGALRLDRLGLPYELPFRRRADEIAGESPLEQAVVTAWRSTRRDGIARPQSESTFAVADGAMSMELEALAPGEVRYKLGELAPV